MITIAWILALLGIILDAYSDVSIDRDGQRKHLVESLSVASCFSSALLFGMFITFTTITNTLIGLGITLFIISSLRLGIFNLAYNYFMGLDYSHLGTTSKIDELLNKLPNFVTIVIYWASILSSIIVSALLYTLW